MAVHLVLQNDQGTIGNANAYILASDPTMWTVVPGPLTSITGPFGFFEYHSDRGQVNTPVYDPVTGKLSTFTLASNSTVYTADMAASAVIRATDYIDKRFSFVGYRRYSNQPTSWPRWDAVDVNDRYLRGIPLAVQQATAEYALRALVMSQLVADPTRDKTGQQIKSLTKKIGVLEVATVFNGSFEMPRYPAADAILRNWGLIITGGKLVRG